MRVCSGRGSLFLHTRRRLRRKCTVHTPPSAQREPRLCPLPLPTTTAAQSPRRRSRRRERRRIIQRQIPHLPALPSPRIRTQGGTPITTVHDTPLCTMMTGARPSTSSEPRIRRPSPRRRFPTRTRSTRPSVPRSRAICVPRRRGRQPRARTQVSRRHC